MPLDQQLNDEKEMSFLDHLEELRWHLIRSLIAIIVFTIVAFVSAKWVFQNVIFAPARPDFPTFKALCRLGDLLNSPDLCITSIPFQVQSRNMTGQFTMHIMASFIIGLVIAFPYVCWEIWRFIRPGLQRREQKYSKGAVAAVSILFFCGVSFG
ncbi:MAG: twin-arginine translocase subunit TatC, partial [Chryseolinea sp.]